MEVGDLDAVLAIEGDELEAERSRAYAAGARHGAAVLAREGAALGVRRGAAAAFRVEFWCAFASAAQAVLEVDGVSQAAAASESPGSSSVSLPPRREEGSVQKLARDCARLPSGETLSASDSGLEDRLEVVEADIKRLTANLGRRRGERGHPPSSPASKVGGPVTVEW